MADLTGPGEGAHGDNRGQVLLVAAFALAVTFVAFALVANSAIYTENLATRAGGEDTTDAVIFRDSIEQSVGDAMQAANERNSASYTPVKTTVQMGIQNLSDWTGKQEARASALGTVEYLTSTQGSRIVQPEPANFSSSNASTAPVSDWTVVENVSGTRAFRVNVTDTTPLSPVAGDNFTVTLTEEGGATSWEVQIGKNTSGAVEVTVNRENPSLSATCTAPTPGPVVIDVTEGTIDGQSCPALDVVSGEETHLGAGVPTPYNITFTNGDNIEGRYSLVVDNATLGSNPDVSAGVGEPGTTDTQPYAYPAMYSATVEASYYTDIVEYRTEIRVTPGDPA